jgi:small subunit ribosomal protein S17
MPKKKLIGKVVSTKMQKTLVVETERVKKHPKYERRYKINDRYKAHYETGEFSVGDVVVIEETRPISKDKKWKVVEKLENSKGQNEEVMEEKI